MEGLGVNFDKAYSTRLQEILTYLYDTQVFYFGGGVVSNTPVESVPTITKGSAGRYAGVELQIDDAYGWQVDVRPDYTNHYIRATIWYTATGSSANAFAITAQVTGVPSDSSVDGASFEVWAESTTAPGPAATHRQQSVVLTLDDATVKSGDHHSIFFQITRTTDTNANSLLITKVQLFFYKAPA